MCQQESHLIEAKGCELDLELKERARQVKLKRFRTTKKTSNPVESEVRNPPPLYRIQRIYYLGIGDMLLLLALLTDTSYCIRQLIKENRPLLSLKYQRITLGT
jgi:hypothetical protein